MANISIANNSHRIEENAAMPNLTAKLYSNSANETSEVGRVSYKQSNSTFGNPPSSYHNSLSPGEKPEGSQGGPHKPGSPGIF
jgi:hypothetical protein